MHEFTILNHEIVRAENSVLSAVSNAALYGKGVFTTVAVYDSRLFLWEKHWRRLTENAKKIGVDTNAFSETRLKDSLLEIINKNNLIDGRARITFFDETTSRIWQNRPSRKTTLFVQTADFRRRPKKLRLTVSPFPVNSKSPLAGVKSCNYLENILALEDAAARGFDEAVRLNERGEIASAAAANVFWTKKEKIYTPALETGCLAGTIREFVCEKFSVVETKAELSELDDADGIFLTSAGIGIARVSEFQNRKLRGEPHRITARFERAILKARAE